MSRFYKFYEEYSKILENSTREYIPTKKMYGDIIIFLTSGKAGEKYDEKMRKNWKCRLLNILLKSYLGINPCLCIKSYYLKLYRGS